MVINIEKNTTVIKEESKLIHFDNTFTLLTDGEYEYVRVYSMKSICGKEYVFIPINTQNNKVYKKDISDKVVIIKEYSYHDTLRLSANENYIDAIDLNKIKPVSIKELKLLIKTIKTKAINTKKALDGLLSRDEITTKFNLYLLGAMKLNAPLFNYDNFIYNQYSHLSFIPRQAQTIQLINELANISINSNLFSCLSELVRLEYNSKELIYQNGDPISVIHAMGRMLEYCNALDVIYYIEQNIDTVQYILKNRDKLFDLYSRQSICVGCILDTLIKSSIELSLKLDTIVDKLRLIEDLVFDFSGSTQIYGENEVTVHIEKVDGEVKTIIGTSFIKMKYRSNIFDYYLEVCCHEDENHIEKPLIKFNLFADGPKGVDYLEMQREALDKLIGIRLGILSLPMNIKESIQIVSEEEF